MFLLNKRVNFLRDLDPFCVWQAVALKVAFGDGCVEGNVVLPAEATDSAEGLALLVDEEEGVPHPVGGNEVIGRIDPLSDGGGACNLAIEARKDIVGQMSYSVDG